MWLECAGGSVMARHVGALDQGPPVRDSWVFDAEGREAARHQLEHRQILPGPGLVEHDPIEIVSRTNDVMAGALAAAGLTGRDLAAIGVTNQRETTVVWDPTTGRPWHNALVWQDTRTDHVRARAGAGARAAVRANRGCRPPPTSRPPSSAGSSITSRACAMPPRRGRALFGTIDTWLIWNLTGGPDGGLHVTDVTNASRTQLMNLRTLDWDDGLLGLFGVPRQVLPAIVRVVCPRSLRHHTRERTAGRGGANRRQPGRSACCDDGPGLLCAG